MRRCGPWTVLALAAALQGCAAASTDQSGFLGRTVDFEPATDGSGALVYRKPGFKPGDWVTGVKAATGLDDITRERVDAARAAR